MSKRSSSDVRNDSRKAVEVAGMRARRGLSGSAGAWGGPRKITVEDMLVGAVPSRPGKTARKRGR